MLRSIMILIRQSHVYDQVGLVTAEKSHKFLYAVGVNTVGVGPRDSYLLYHEELESLVINFPTIKRARFWMTFGQMTAVVIYIIRQVLALLVLARYAAAYRGLAVIILAEILRVGQHGLQELQRYDFSTVVLDFVYTRHAYVLNDTQMCQILLSESHPEACALDCREAYTMSRSLTPIRSSKS